MWSSCSAIRTWTERSGASNCARASSKSSSEEIACPFRALLWPRNNAAAASRESACCGWARFPGDAFLDYILNMTLQDALATLRRHESALRERGVAHAAVFGSVVRGDDRPDSD